MIRKKAFNFSLLFLISLGLFGHSFALSASAEQHKRTPSQIALRPRALPPKPAFTQIAANASVSHVVVKFRDDVGIRYRVDRLVSKTGMSVKEAESILKPYLNSRFRRLFQDLSEDRLDRDRQTFQMRAKQELPDLNSYYRIQVTDPAEAEQIVNALNRLDVIEIAYIQPMPEPADDIDPPTPDYQPFQGYREAAPDGIDADYANTLPGGDGTGVKIIDIEGNWQITHEDLDKALGGIIAGEPINTASWRNHGTAVIGELIAGDNGYGVTGICPGADIGMVSIGGWTTAEALYAAIDTLQQGDIILIELHAPGPHYDFQPRPDQLGYVCMEYWQANYDAIQYAWAKGIIVVEAAGNGAENFDDTTIYGLLFDTTYRNSHAIIVGAGYPPTSPNDLQKHGFSNYGARVNLQGYGSEVYTTGYGDLFDGGGDEDQYYTSGFSGTSSASPIVAGAAACLQGYYKATYNVTLTSDNIRVVLVATGTPQQGDTSLHIGPRPDLQSAIAALTGPPSLYTKPIYIDTTIDEGSVGITALWIINRSSTETFDFSIIDNDSLAKMVEEDWLVASPQTGTVMPADSFAIDVILDATVIEDRVDIYTGVLEIYWGPSGGSLDSLTLVPVFLQVPCNDSTYQATSSDEPEGPVYQWISAKDLGDKISNSAFSSSGSDPLDDGTAGPFGIGFDFWYYDTFYTQVHIGVNGAISFTDTALNVNGYFSTLEIPGAPFTTFIAPFWNDLIIDTGAVPEAGVYLYRDPTFDTCVIEWYHVSNFNDPGDTTTNFEIVLTIDGNILFQYKDIGTSGLEQTALIGISEYECRALSYFNRGDNPENEVSNSEAVLIENTTRVWMQSGNVDGQ
ncbi:MAG: S8 family serine peptidase, partial [Candidatus Zixiibacteriota bacterium]